MGGKKPGQKIEGYFADVHYGVCIGPVNKVWDIRISEKSVVDFMSPAVPWEVSGTYAITSNAIFGGETQEGGAYGNVNALFGESTQFIGDYLATNLGLTPTTAPGFRGVFSVFLYQFFWGFTNPFLRPVEVEVECIPQSWNPTTSKIFLDASTSAFQGYVVDSSALTANGQQKLDSFGSYNFNGESASGMLTWTIPGNVLTTWRPRVGNQAYVEGFHVVADNLLVTRRSNFAGYVEEDIIFYDFAGAIVHSGLDTYISTHGAGFAAESCFSNYGTTVFGITFDGAGGMDAFNIDTGTWAINNSHMAVPSGFNGALLQADLAQGPLYAYSLYFDGSNYTGIYRFDVVGLTYTLVMPSIGGRHLANVAYDAITDCVIVVCTDGSIYKYSDDLSTQLASNTATGIGTVNTGTNKSSRMCDSGFVWVARQQGFSGSWDIYQFETALLTQVTHFNSLDSATGVAWGWVDSNRDYNWAVYNPQVPGFYMFHHNDMDAFWPLPGTGRADMNPAHIIYHTLTNAEWGMGAPTYALDLTSFSDAASTLYTERFGLSMKWDKQTSIETFVNEVLSHINGTIFLNPSTGLITLKLIRADYTIGALTVLDETNCTVTSFARKSWGDTTNEILCQWTNPESEQEETVVAHDLGNMAIQGGIISDTRDYYGIRRADLAMQAALRDVSASSWPTAMVELEADRIAWSFTPAECFVLNWTEYGLANMVFRVTTIDYGKPGDSKIKISAVEDIFSLTQTQYTVPGGSTGWVSPAVDPTQLAFRQAFTLPYVVTVRLQPTFVDTQFPDVAIGLLCGQTGTDTDFAELFGPKTTTTGTDPYADLGSVRICKHSTTVGSLIAEATTTITSAQYTAPTQGQTIAVGDFVILGSGSADDVMEMCLVTAYNSTTESLTLQRGCLDTIPKAWSASTPIWFFSTDTTLNDPQTRSFAESLSYKPCAITSNGIFPVASATAVTWTAGERPYLPSRPANVQVGTSTFGVDFDATSGANFNVTWANRNRVTEDSVILAWTDSTVAIEVGQTTSIHVYAADGTTLLGTISGLTGTSHTINPNTDLFSASLCYLKVVSVRAGYESLTGMTFKVLAMSDDEWTAWFETQIT